MPGDATVTEREARPGSGARRLRVAAVVIAVLVVIAGIVVPLVATSTPGFFARYHLLERRFVNLEGSAHEGIGCRSCHETRPLANGLQLVGDFYTSIVATDEMPVYFTFKPPTNDACLACHRNDWTTDATRLKRIPHPAHLRVDSETRDCVKCHKWTAHFEGYIEKHKTMPFSGVCVAYGCHVGTKQTPQCFNCHHILHADAAQWKVAHPKVVRATGESPCLESCHTVAQCQECHTTGKTPKFTGRRIEVGMAAIEKLHVKPDWTQRYHGPEALKDVSKCLLCHETKGYCDECHLLRPAFHGQVLTWIGRHAKVAKSVDDPRCLTCHAKPMCLDCHAKFKEMG